MIREKKTVQYVETMPCSEVPLAHVKWYLILAGMTLAFLGGSQDKTPITQIYVVDVNSNYQIGSWSN